MSTFKCKMCGGTVEFDLGATVGVCDSCGTKQTLPRLDDNKKANLYDRANHFRRNNDFDKAMSIYEQILNEDKTDAESYWSLVLCRYGIEYVEDPATHRRVPTVNRAQYTSVFADEDYRSALQYADGSQKAIYETEAKAIDEIQKGILEISQKEEPFDVFICYKDTDANGRRTQDSVLANELYHELTNEGFKVFFSRITLEDKLGTAYEPYIFAALNSAKVMVVLGTKPEYFNAVWVKNEWSRYLALIKNGAKKMLIPAYRDMDPYDLPEEFSHLQAQDMSKLGFMQDLIRGIKKIIGDEAPKATAKEPIAVQQPTPAANSNVEALLERGYMALEDSEWQKADGFFEEVLNQEAKNARAYLGKLMAELRVGKQENLKNCAEPFDGRNNYQKVLRFGDAALADELKGDIKFINDRNENARLAEAYQMAEQTMQGADTEENFLSAAEQFESIAGFSDAAVKAKKCREQAEVCRKDAIYASARSYMVGPRADAYETAMNLFKTIPGWQDADEQIYVCQKKIEEIRAKAKAERLAWERKVEADRLEDERKAEERRIAAEKAAKKRKKVIAITAPIVCACIAFLIVLTTVIIPTSNYNRAISLLNDGKIIDAYESLEALNGYKDSATKVSELFDQYMIEKLKIAEVGDIVFFGAYEQDNNTSNGKEDVEWIVLAKENGKALVISRYAIDCQQYNTSRVSTTWETCSLRTWLNDTFLNTAFSSDEQAMIATTNVGADKNPKYSTNPGNATNDKVFLLSTTEAEKYFSTDKSRRCALTAYSIAQRRASTSSSYTTASGETACWWWLRSPGNNPSSAINVSSNGSVNYNGNYVNYGHDAVRPALWINQE